MKTFTRALVALVGAHLLFACGGVQPATPLVAEAAERQTEFGCLSPDGATFVYDSRNVLLAMDVRTGESLFTVENGRLVYCDADGIVVARKTNRDEAGLEVQVLEYTAGQPLHPPAGAELPECAANHWGRLHFQAGPSSEAVGFSWSVIYYAPGPGFRPPPSEDGEPEEPVPECEESGALAIDRGDGRVTTSSYVDWERTPSNPPTIDGIAIREQIHSYGTCQPQEPAVSTVSGVRGSEVLWSTEVPPYRNDDDDCRP